MLLDLLLFTLSFSFVILLLFIIFSFFFFNDTATTEIYTLSLHDALPILTGPQGRTSLPALRACWCSRRQERSEEHTSELQSRQYLVCRLLLEKKKKKKTYTPIKKKQKKTKDDHNDNKTMSHKHAQRNNR